MHEAARRALETGRATKVDGNGLRAAGAAWFEGSRARAAPSQLMGVSHWPALVEAHHFLTQLDAMAAGITQVRVTFDRREVESHAHGAALPFLASCTAEYRVGYVPASAWVVERSSAVIGVARTDGSSNEAIQSEAPELVEAVAAYIDAVAATTCRADELVRTIPSLTHRQHAVAAVLLEVRTDTEVAEVLRTSVRTVQREIDALCRFFGVSNRAALGVAYGRATALRSAA
jgi:hypothetical protein